MTDTDRLFSDDDAPGGPFRFDERVARVFGDMIERSVPGYREVLQGIALISRRHAQPGSRLYDLGCSLGAATLSMRHAVPAADVRIVAVDNAPAMVERCRQAVAEDNSVIPVDVIEADIGSIDIEDASVVVLNYTLQFVDVPGREPLLRRIRDGLRPGGVLVLAEKLRHDDPAVQDLLTDWHHEFKRAQGYSDLEIARKRTALEDVLQPETEDEHRRRFERLGMSPVVTWHRALPFVAMAAFKPR